LNLGLFCIFFRFNNVPLLAPHCLFNLSLHLVLFLFRFWRIFLFRIN